MNSIVISVANDFSAELGPRLRQDGEHSSEEFCEDFIFPALNDYELITIDLNGIKNPSMSFFFGMSDSIKQKITIEVAVKRVHFKSSEKEFLADKLNRMISNPYPF